MTVWGALPSHWRLYTDAGLTADLLPVVSNPQATVSALSSLKAIGKVPSKYNAEHKVVGIPAWTAHMTTRAEIAKWQKESDYGICIQCRYWRAIDIDTEDNKEALAIIKFISGKIGMEPAIRFRRGASKYLIPVIINRNELITKQRIAVNSGYIEFLGNGCQFVAEGTHPSGSRYEWKNNGGVPSLTLSELEKLLA